MKEIDYYKNVSAELSLLEFNPTTYITNSSLSAINPEQGGSPIKFLNYFKEDRDRTTQALSTGKRIHKYIESPEEFIVADFEKPSGMKPAMIEGLYSRGIKASDLAMLNEDIFLSCMEEAGYKRRPTLTEEDQKYLQHLWDAEGKIALTLAEKVQIQRMIDSLKNHSRISQYLFENIIDIGSVRFEIGKDFKRLNELAIYWTEENQIGEKVYRKALIDTYIIFPASNTVVKIDLKTTSKSIYGAGSEEGKRGWLETWNIYRQVAYYDEAIENLYLNPTAYAVTRDGRTIKPQGDLPDIDNYIVGVETKGDFLAGMIPVPSDWILEGKREIKSLIDRIFWHSKKNKWKYSKEEEENGLMIPIGRRTPITRLMEF